MTKHEYGETDRIAEEEAMTARIEPAPYQTIGERDAAKKKMKDTPKDDLEKVITDLQVMRKGEAAGKMMMANSDDTMFEDCIRRLKGLASPNIGADMELLDEVARLRKEFAEAIRGECHDAAEQDMGCFRAVKAERELAEARREIQKICQQQFDADQLAEAELAEMNLVKNLNAGMQSEIERLQSDLQRAIERGFAAGVAAGQERTRADKAEADLAEARKDVERLRKIEAMAQACDGIDMGRFTHVPTVAWDDLQDALKEKP